MTKRHLSPSDARDNEDNDNIKRVCSEEASDRYADYIICLHYCNCSLMCWPRAEVYFLYLLSTHNTTPVKLLR